MATEKSSVLILGGSGYVGSALAAYLTKQGYTVSILSRYPELITKYNSFYWNPDKGQVDKNAFLNQDYIINFSGVSISKKYWTKKRRQQILESRIKPLKLLKETLKSLSTKPKKILTASAVGYYGSVPGKQIDESVAAGKGFLAMVCQKWENEADKIEIPIVKMRLGVVLSKNGGYVKQISKVLNTRVNIIWGSGRQKVSWIHLNDLLRAIEFLLETETKSVYNLTSPRSVSSLDLNKAIAKWRNIYSINFRLPGSVTKAVFGRFSELFLTDQAVVPRNLIEQNFSFHYNNLDDVFILR